MRYERVRSRLSVRGLGVRVDGEVEGDSKFASLWLLIVVLIVAAGVWLVVSHALAITIIVIATAATVLYLIRATKK